MTSIHSLIRNFTQKVPFVTDVARKVLPLSVKRKLGTILLSNNQSGVVKSQDGRQFKAIPDRLFLRVVYNGNYEPGITKIISSAVEPGDTCVDIGANFGWFTTLLATKTKHVFSYEPAQRIREILNENIALNGLADKVDVRGVAVGAEKGEATFVIEGKSDRESALGYVSTSDTNMKNTNTETVSIVVLDEDLKRAINNIALIKIDAEGYEHYALQGAKKILGSKNPPIITVEANAVALERAGTTRDAVCDLLKSFGYKLYEMHYEGTLSPDDGNASDLICLPAKGKFANRISV